MHFQIGICQASVRAPSQNLPADATRPKWQEWPCHLGLIKNAYSKPFASNGGGGGGNGG